MNNCILDEWKINYKKVPPSFEEFCTDIKVYKLKYSWQRFIPRFILHRLIKPTTFKNCYPMGFGKGDDVVTQSITMNYEEFEKFFDRDIDDNLLLTNS